MKRTVMIYTAILALAGTVIAQPGRGPGVRSGRGFTAYGMGRGWQMLNLTEEQQTKFNEMHLAHMKEVTAFHNKRAEQDLKLRTLRSADPIDSKAVFAMIEEIGVLKTEMAKAQETFRMKLREQLTEDQRVIFDSRPMGFGTGRSCRGSRVGRMQGGFGGRGMYNGSGGMRGW